MVCGLHHIGCGRDRDVTIQVLPLNCSVGFIHITLMVDDKGTSLINIAFVLQHKNTIVTGKHEVEEVARGRQDHSVCEDVFPLYHKYNIAQDPLNSKEDILLLAIAFS